MENEGCTVKFDVVAMRTLKDPVDPQKRTRRFAFCDVAALPHNLPTSTNPREQNTKTKVAKKINEGLVDPDTSGIFHLLNRGMLISAARVEFDNATNEITIHMPNPTTHGVVDGGHTYRIIREAADRGELPEGQYVTLEIMTGIEDDFTEIAGARNTSIQVKDKSLANLEGKLDVVKRIVATLPFAKDIAYKEYAEGNLDVLDVVAVLTIFHKDLRQSGDHPVDCYNSKARALDWYLNNVDSYEKLGPIAREVFQLHDHVKETFGDVYNATKDGPARFGGLTEIGYSKDRPRFPLLFSERDEEGNPRLLHYNIPAGFTYPILGALRYIVEYDEANACYTWGVDPIEFYDERVAVDLVRTTMEASYESGRNPSAVGKSRRHWESLYNIVATRYLEMLRERE